jgi:hypothetical protein
MKTSTRTRLISAIAFATLLAPAVASADVYNVAIGTKSSRFTSVLDVAAGSTAPGAKLIQYIPTSGANQRWNIVTAPPLSGAQQYQIVNAKTGFCLTSSGVVGQQLSVTYCNNANPRQRWSGIPQATASSVFDGPSGRLSTQIPGTRSVEFTNFGVPIYMGTLPTVFAAEVQGNSWQPGTAIVTGDGAPGHVAGAEQQFAFWPWN